MADLAARAEGGAEFAARAFLEARGWTEVPDWLPNGVRDDVPEPVVPWNLIARKSP